MSDFTGPQILIDQDIYALPCGDHVTIAAESNALFLQYFKTLRLLLLAGFCLLLTCSPCNGDDIFKPTGRYAVAQVAETVTVKTKTRTKYLVSEPWCTRCPAAKSRFLAAGWPEENVLTIEQARKRFNLTISYVPFEFDEPETTATPSPAVTRSAAESAAEKHLRDTHNIECSGLSMAEMESIHDGAHGGPQYHFSALSQPVYRTQPQTVYYRQRTRRRR